jgi:hypothetical protein
VIPVAVKIVTEECTTSVKVAELTVDELTQVVQEAVEQKLIEMLGDPDNGLELREEIKARLRRRERILEPSDDTRTQVRRSGRPTCTG